MEAPCRDPLRGSAGEAGLLMLSKLGDPARLTRVGLGLSSEDSFDHLGGGSRLPLLQEGGRILPGPLSARAPESPQQPLGGQPLTESRRRRLCIPPDGDEDAIPRGEFQGLIAVKTEKLPPSPPGSLLVELSRLERRASKA